MTLARRLLLLGSLLTIVPLVAVGTIVFVTGRQAQGAAVRGTSDLANADLDHIAQLVYLTCDAYNTEAHRRLNQWLGFAKASVARHGSAGLSASKTITWQARNQLTSASRDVTLPAMQYGGAIIEPNSDPRRPSPVVDEITAAAGGTATIFGMGFAVVAEEVRNLAQRSAQAAKDTAALIEESIDSAHSGAARVEQVGASIGKITESVGHVRGLVEEVSMASSQQTQGIDQVTQAIAQMERVTQTTAATAEESAAASEELAAQSDATMGAVQQLEAIVAGRGSHIGTSLPGWAPQHAARPVTVPRGAGSPA